MNNRLITIAGHDPAPRWWERVGLWLLDGALTALGWLLWLAWETAAWVQRMWEGWL